VGDGEPTAAALDDRRAAAAWAHDHHTLWVNTAMRATGVAARRRVAEWDSWRFPLPEPTAAARSRAVVDGMAANARSPACTTSSAGGRAVWQRLDADRRPRLRVVVVPADMLRLRATSSCGPASVADAVVGACKAFMDGTSAAHGVDARRLGSAAVVGRAGPGVREAARRACRRCTRSATARTARRWTR
jgi:hypothetical protein